MFFKEGKKVKFRDSEEHNKHFKVQVNGVEILQATNYQNFLSAYDATSDIS